ncbi:MAG TPA: FHA domain-containing protein [Vicinamibacterales bacterium]|nr:FHA domain-containing protein [Vicinamibacterales bacterium]
MKPPRNVIRFGAFAIDADARQLLKDGREIPLRPKAFELLLILVNNRPTAMSKAELQGLLWPDSFVTEANLPGLAKEIRHALDDDPHQPRFLRTLHGFGYAFEGKSDDGAGKALSEGEPYQTFWIMADAPVRLSDGVNILGRDPEAAVWFDRPGVSRMHARITISEGVAVLEDLGSTNGTWLGADRLATPQRLTDGDRIRLGPIEVIFRIRRSAHSTEVL